MDRARREDCADQRRLVFDEAVSGHRDRLVRLARRYGPPDEAEDAAHDGVLQALAGLDSFGERAQVGTWLHQIVVNASLMRWRRRLTRTTRIPTSLDTDERSWELASEGEETPAALLEHKEEEARLRQAIDALPQRYRRVAELTFVAERTSDEVAAELGISANAVRTRVCRARHRLAEVLADA